MGVWVCRPAPNRCRVLGPENQFQRDIEKSSKSNLLGAPTGPESKVERRQSGPRHQTKGLEQAFRWVYGFVGLLPTVLEFRDLTTNPARHREIQQVQPAERANGSGIKS